MSCQCMYWGPAVPCQQSTTGDNTMCNLCRRLHEHGGHRIPEQRKADIIADFAQQKVGSNA